MWTDSHCHLQSLSVDDLSQTLDRARDGGVRRMVIVGTDEESSRRASAMAVDLSGTGGPPVEMWATVGLHPVSYTHLGVDGVITDVPSLLAEVLEDRGIAWRH